MTRPLIVFVVFVLASLSLAAQEVTLPVPIVKSEPEYSYEARVAKITGSVRLSVLIGADGVPQEIRVLKSLDPGLDQNAMDAVSKWRFKPGTKDGQPVPVLTTIEVSFKLL